MIHPTNREDCMWEETGGGGGDKNIIKWITQIVFTENESTETVFTKRATTLISDFVQL